MRSGITAVQPHITMRHDSSSETHAAVTWLSVDRWICRRLLRTCGRRLLRELKRPARRRELTNLLAVVNIARTDTDARGPGRRRNHRRVDFGQLVAIVGRQDLVLQLGDQPLAATQLQSLTTMPGSFVLLGFEASAVRAVARRRRSPRRRRRWRRPRCERCARPGPRARSARRTSRRRRDRTAARRSPDRGRPSRRATWA